MKSVLLHVVSAVLLVSCALAARSAHNSPPPAQNSPPAVQNSPPPPPLMKPAKATSPAPSSAKSPSPSAAQPPKPTHKSPAPVKHSPAPAMNHLPPPPPPVPVAKLPLHTIKMPTGFHITLYTQQAVPGARQLALSRGKNKKHPHAVIVYVGTIVQPGNVYALLDRDGSGKHVQVQTVLTGQLRPNGVAWCNDTLYVAEAGQFTAYDRADDYVLAGKMLPKGRVISKAFPASQPIHQDHYIAFGPDDWLYLNQGAESNTGCSKLGNVTRCTIMRMRKDGSHLQVYAHGIRNSVGFDWDPRSRKMFATDNERQGLSSDPDARPDDTLLHLPRKGLNFGFPYCHWVGKGNEYDRKPGSSSVYLDDEQAPRGVKSVNNTAAFLKYCKNASHSQPPVQALGPHAAPLGMKFYHGHKFPAKYDSSIFVTEHGSGNRKYALGFRIVNLQVASNGSALRHTIFAEGWLQDRVRHKFWGRPTDVLGLDDGSLLVSDNYAGAIYSISYSKIGPVFTMNGANIGLFLGVMHTVRSLEA